MFYFYNSLTACSTNKYKSLMRLNLIYLYRKFLSYSHPFHTLITHSTVNLANISVFFSQKYGLPENKLNVNTKTLGRFHPYISFQIFPQKVVEIWLWKHNLIMRPHCSYCFSGRLYLSNFLSTHPINFWEFATETPTKNLNLSK